LPQLLAEKDRQKEIGPKLVHGAAFTLSLQPPGEARKPPVCGLGSIGREIAPFQAGGAELVSPYLYIAVLDRFSVSEAGLVGIGQITELLHPGPDL
jgi:hypothetical protein